MIEVKLKNLSVKKKSLLLTFFVLFTLFISFENVFAQKFNIKDYVLADRYAKGESITITAKVYDYLLRPMDQFLQSCTIEFSVDNVNYTKLMDINTPKQNINRRTKINFFNKLDGARIRFDKTVFIFGLGGLDWEEGNNLSAFVLNESNECEVAFLWQAEYANLQVRYLRISGKWINEASATSPTNQFENVTYKLRSPIWSMLKSNTPDIITKSYKNEIVNVFKESEDIVIKGAEPGANIKVYTTSGVEIKSVISNNDVVKIKLPAKQLYFVHVGESRHRVAM